MIHPVGKAIVEKYSKSSMEVGKIIPHPDGRMVKIMSGQYWGQHGVSNFWTWREVKKNGKLGKEEHGYGW